MKIKLEIRHYMILFLSILALIGMFKFGFQLVFLHVLVTLVSALIIDSVINYVKLKRFILSPSTIITGLIVAGVLSFDSPNHLLITGIASAVAVLAKHFIVYNKRHVFNPASIGILIASLIFISPVSWWAASNIWLTIIFGLFILYKLKKYELTLSYLIAHSIIVIAIAIFTKSSVISNLQLTNLYFVSFMLIEPMTSPLKKKARIAYGSLVAVISLISLQIFPTIDHSIVGLLIANAFSRVLDKKLI